MQAAAAAAAKRLVHLLIMLDSNSALNSFPPRVTRDWSYGAQRLRAAPAFRIGRAKRKQRCETGRGIPAARCRGGIAMGSQHLTGPALCRCTPLNRSLNQNNTS